MSKRGNYFIAVYDKDDNNVMEFESIQQCADYFSVKYNYIKKCIHELKKVRNEFLLFKIDSTKENLSKSL